MQGVANRCCVPHCGFRTPVIRSIRLLAIGVSEPLDYCGYHAIIIQTWLEEYRRITSWCEDPSLLPEAINLLELVIGLIPDEYQAPANFYQLTTINWYLWDCAFHDTIPDERYARRVWNILHLQQQTFSSPFFRQ